MTAPAAFLDFGALVLLVIGIVLALRPVEAIPHTETAFAFISFYFLLLGLHFMFGGPAADDGILLGDLFASLALTFFWATRRR